VPILFGCIAIAVHGVKWIISTWIRAIASIPAWDRLSFIADPKIPPVKILLEADEDVDHLESRIFSDYSLEEDCHRIAAVVMPERTLRSSSKNASPS